jgi:hypothetical protein
MLYLPIGANKSIRAKDIIGIFDFDTATIGQDTRDYLRALENDGSLETAAEGIPKSFILYGSGKDDENVALSTFAPAILAGRRP